MRDRYQGARNFAEKFYKSKAWKMKSKQYRDLHPFCEKCLERGYFNPSEIVHHKVHINRDNQHDLSILLDDSNLEALCRECHGEEHSDRVKPRFDEKGGLMI